MKLDLILKKLINWPELENTVLWPYPAQLQFRIFVKNKIREIIKFNDVVLDIGTCEDRWRVDCVSKGAQYITLDYIEWVSVYQNNVRKIKYVQPDLYGDCRSLAFLESSINVILLFDVLEHIDTPHKALREIISCLKPGGKLILTVPWFLEIHGGVEGEDDWFRFTPRGLRELAIQNSVSDIQILKLGGFGSSLITIMAGFFIRNLVYRGIFTKPIWIVFGVIVILLLKTIRRMVDHLDRAGRNPTVLMMVVTK